MKDYIKVSKIKKHSGFKPIFILMALLSSLIFIEAPITANAASSTCEAQSGTVNGMNWEITTSCELILGKAGQTQNFSSGLVGCGYNVISGSQKWPWNSSAENIKTATFAGKVIANGGLDCMFSGMSNLTNIQNIKNLDTTNVTDMGNMFSGVSSLKSLDVSYFNTSNVVNMWGMFANASSLTSLDLSSWDTSKVIDMRSMFSGDSSLVSLNVSNWDTSNVIHMNYLFANASSLTSLDLSSWDTSKVEERHSWGTEAAVPVDKINNMSKMFENTSSLQSVAFGPGWTKWTNDAYLMTPPSETTTGRWIKLNSSLPSKTPAELYNELPKNLATYTGVWVWEMKSDTIEDNILDDNKNVKNILPPEAGNVINGFFISLVLLLFTAIILITKTRKE